MFKKIRISNLAVVCFCVMTLLGTASLSFAQTQWEKEHPRRAEVNRRIDNQNNRINHELKEGKISPEQAKQEHMQERKIRHEERAMARQNGGRITKPEQRELNQQLNVSSQQIGR